MSGGAARRALREARPRDRAMDEAVRRLAERVRRDGHASTVRVRTVDPALLRGMVPDAAATLVTPRLDGRCVTCGTQTGANLEAPSRRRGERTPRKPLRKGQAGVGAGLPSAAAGRRALQAHTCRECRKRRRGGYNRGRGGGGRPVHISEELLAEARRLYAGGPQPPAGRGRASPAHRLQDGRLVRGGAVRALQAPGLEAPPPARSDRCAQPQARAKKRASRRARSRTPTAAGRPRARLVRGTGAGPPAVPGRQAQPAREGQAVPAPRARRL